MSQVKSIDAQDSLFRLVFLIVFDHVPFLEIATCHQTVQEVLFKLKRTLLGSALLLLLSCEVTNKGVKPATVITTDTSSVDHLGLRLRTTGVMLIDKLVSEVTLGARHGVTTAVACCSDVLSAIGH